MICGHCGVSKHEHCNGLLKTSFGFCACADRGHVEVGEQPPSRSCEFCPRTAWHVKADDRADGTRVYQCAAGHLAIVAPESSPMEAR